MRRLEISQLALRFAQTRIQSKPRRARLAASIAQQGQLTPVLVHAEGETFVLLDGYVRVAALKDLGQDHVLALEVETTLTEALLASQRLQTGRRPTAMEQAWLLRVLLDEHGLERATLAAKLERSPSWVSRRLALLEVLPEAVQTAIRRGDLSPQAAMKSLVPLARANAEHCERLVHALRGASPSVRELDHLYRSWRAASATVRERIVDRPQLFLRAVTSSERVAIATVAKRLAELSQLCTEINRSLPQPPLNPSLQEHWAQAYNAFTMLTARIEHGHA